MLLELFWKPYLVLIISKSNDNFYFIVSKLTLTCLIYLDLCRFTFWENVNNYVREFTFLELNEVIIYSTKLSKFMTVINSGVSLLSTLYFIGQSHLRLKPIYWNLLRSYFFIFFTIQTPSNLQKCIFHRKNWNYKDLNHT